jgi:hypothetical protein
MKMGDSDKLHGEVSGYLGLTLVIGGQNLLIAYPTSKILPYQLFDSFTNSKTGITNSFEATLAVNGQSYELSGPARLLTPGEFGFVANSRSNLFGNSATITAANALKQQYGIWLQNVRLDLQGLRGVDPFQNVYALSNGERFRARTHKVVGLSATS